MASHTGIRHSGTEVRTVGDRSGRDLAATAQALARWLQAQLPAASDLHIDDLGWPQGAGMSNETLLFNARWHEGGAAHSTGLVARIAPHVVQFFKDADLRQQFDLLRALHAGKHVKVAEPLWFEADAAVLGQPFYVMRRLEGRVPVSFPPYNQSGFVFEATPAERERLWRSAMTELCRVALTPVDAVAGVLVRPQLGASGFDQHATYWREARAWAAGDTAPALLAAESWFERHRPVDTPDGLCWGDARIGNMMFGADYRLTGGMDWEQASLGGPRFDLGWWLTFDKLHSSTLGLQRLAGLGTRQQTLEFWQQQTGLRAADLDWYEAYAGYTLGVIVCRRYAEAGTERPGHNRNNNNYTRHMAELMGVATPHDVILNPA
jgi:aminoglycoside phosphotransferase (APT) family kinase protein